MDDYELPSVSVLVINYEGKKYLGNCLRSVLRANYPDFEVYLVDNGSHDKSVDYVKENFPEIKIIANERNLGFGEAYNKAIGIVESDYVALLNNDVEVTEDWLMELVNVLVVDEKAAAATSKILFLDDKSRINSCGGVMDEYGFGVNRGNGEVDGCIYSEVEEVFYAVGAVMMVKKSMWTYIGGFDRDYFAYFEDSDWGWRARLKGLKILYAPHSIVYHLWRGSFTKRDNVIYYYTRNRLATLIKNYSLKNLMKIFPVYVMICLLESLWILYKWSIKEEAAFISAFIWNLKNFRRRLSLRYRVQRGRFVSDSDIQKYMIRHSLELKDVMKRGAHRILSHPFIQEY